MASAVGKDIIPADLGWVVSTGKFGSINTGLNLTGIAASAIKGPKVTESRWKFGDLEQSVCVQ